MSTSLEHLFSLDGKVAVVTGGASGIGRMIAEGLVAAGARVHVTSRTQEKAEKVAAELASVGQCVGLAAELSTLEGVAALATAVAAAETRIHILVNNAGATGGAPIEAFPDEELDREWNVNVKAVFHLTRLLLPQLRAAAQPNDPARVINIGSVNGTVVPELPGRKGIGPARELYGYASTKAAVHMLSRHLAHRLAHEHITVNVIAPGPFESQLTSEAFATEEGRRRAEDMVPLQRIGCSDDAAGTAVYLASRAGSYLTGSIIALDGGWTSHG